MPGFSRGGVIRFGWSATCLGRRPSKVRDDVRSLAEWAAHAWDAHFPRERGYATTAEPAGGGAGLVATRGDFIARLTIEHGTDACSATDPSVWVQAVRVRAVRVRVFGAAMCTPMLRAEELAERRIAGGRVVGAAIGLLVFGAFCWLSLGVADPIFVLGGLLMVVTLVVTTFAGATFGAYLGEQLGERARRRASDRAARDPAIEADLRRWKAFTRQLMAQRAAFVAGPAQQPFRREPTQLTG